MDELTNDVLPALIARLRTSELGELEVRTPRWRVRLRRALPVASAGAQANRRVPRDRAAAPHAADLDAGAVRRPLMAVGPDAPGGSPPRGADLEPRAATSPAVGYFSPRPELHRGQRVLTGDLLGWVDVLGVRHDVTSPVDGAVARQVALQGEAVEYGQPLVEVEPLPAEPAPVQVPPPGSTLAVSTPSRTEVQESVRAGGAAVPREVR